MQTILIVDDKTENLYLLQALLQGNGFTVVTAENGAEALALARRSPPALVISDILMPIMDGFTLCREWRQDPGLRHLPFIFYTATYTDSEDERFAMSLGADVFLVKPVAAPEILTHVRSLIAQSQEHPVPPDLKPAVKPEITYLQEYNQVLIHKLEDKLADLERANAELRALDLMKSNLLKNVSHELRTPLLIISNYAERIGGTRSAPGSNRNEEDAAVILRNTNRLLHLINNLIFMADPRPAESKRPVAEIPLESLFAEAADSVRDKASEKKIRLTVEPVQAVIRGNRPEIMHALWNLLDNGVKFTPTGGAVTLSAMVMPDTIRLTVSDTGIQIPPQQQQRIFERFYMADPSTTRLTGGLGLGLSIVREIAERHGGRIELLSEAGRGNIFTLVLPQSGE